MTSVRPAERRSMRPSVRSQRTDWSCPSWSFVPGSEIEISCPGVASHDGGHCDLLGAASVGHANQHESSGAGSGIGAIVELHDQHAAGGSGEVVFRLRVAVVVTPGEAGPPLPWVRHRLRRPSCRRRRWRCRRARRRGGDLVVLRVDQPPAAALIAPEAETGHVDDAREEVPRRTSCTPAQDLGGAAEEGNASRG